jgi:hypothetical protein
METLNQKGTDVCAVKTYKCFLPSSITSIAAILGVSGEQITLIPLFMRKERQSFRIYLSNLAL